jgi:hypothetical protein
MKTILTISGVLVACFIALAIVTATPLVGEVVKLHTRGTDGEWQTTPLWIVDLGSDSYLRAGTPDESGWITRIRGNPEARLERSGKLLGVTLLEEPARLHEVHEKMAEKYGWADGFVKLVSGDRRESLPLRVEILDGSVNSH